MAFLLRIDELYVREGPQATVEVNTRKVMHSAVNVDKNTSYALPTPSSLLHVRALTHEVIALTVSGLIRHGDRPTALAIGKPIAKVLLSNYFSRYLAAPSKPRTAFM